MDDAFGEEGARRRQIALLAVVGAVLLALVYLMFLRGGGTPPQQEAVTPPAADPVAQAESDEDPFDDGTGGDNKAPLETYQVFASRDPFKPVVPGADAAKGKDKGAAGDVPAQNEEGDAQMVVPTAPRAAQEIEGHTVALVDVFREEGTNKAQVEIDATGYKVSEGEVFAENFQLVSTSGGCATLLYGDDQFTMCEGEEILK